MDVKNFVLSGYSSVMGDAAAPGSFTGTAVQNGHSTLARCLRPSARIF
jgi:hypothetical protein